jgi:hypothetical protein
MTRKSWRALGPSLVLAAGIVVSTLAALLAARSGWLVLAGPLLLALAVVGADVLDSRLRGRSSRPSRAAFLLGGAFLWAGLIVALRDPGLVKTLVLVLGPMSWVTLFLRAEGRRRPCRSL